MRVRRIANAAATMFVAIVVALAVPVSQLRTVSEVTTCCCPDPAHCHCPDHKPDHSKQPSIRACHRTTHEIVAPQLPAFAPPVIAIAEARVAVESPALVTLRSPHAPPPPIEPDGPS